jgi:predicted secreted protein
MNQDEISEFKLQLERNEELRNRTVSKAIFLKTLKKVGKEKDQEIIEKIKGSKIAAATAPAAPTTPSRFTLFIRYTTAVAACICVLFYIDFQIAKNNIQTLGTEYLAYAPTFEGDGQFKGATDLGDIENELEQIFEKVKSKKDIEDNILKLTEMYNKSMSKTLNQYTNYIDYIGYYLAISHLQNNDKDMAINVLSELLVNSPDFEKANKLLNEIKKIKGLW